ncbi:MAG: DUF4942 domain-containing protein [Dechloromonas sp.]|nr:DUF4942 domain-containing protein [Dechloromonas sp.]
MNAIVPRQSIEHIVACRDKALHLYEDAYRALELADRAVTAAHEMARQAAPLEINSYTCDRVPEISEFEKAIALPDRDRFLRTARKLTDVRCWGHIVKMTDLERLMDVEAKEKLLAQMAYVPDRVDRDGELITEEEVGRGMPPLTVDNVYATLEQFRGNLGMIFRRGIANAFSKLDRRFKSHDGFKIGSRMIMTRLFNDNGWMNWGRDREVLIDVERVFYILDHMDDDAGAVNNSGEIERSFKSTLHMLESERGGWSPHQSLHENAYFKVRCFMNGNAHLWFTRKDLVEKVNKLLAEYYGEVIGDGQTAEEDPLQNRKMTPARNFGFFPTPPDVADHLFRETSVLRGRGHPQMRILEPSAGTGVLARRCVVSISNLDDWSGGRERHAKDYRFDNLVDCVEIQPELANRLADEGIYNHVVCGDFLRVSPDPIYDLVVMNPPFDRERDIDHITHAFKFLKPGGRLVAIMAAGVEFRETRKAAAFRKMVEANKSGRCGRYLFEDLPPGSFADAGTYVNTVIVRMTKKMMA